jgi:hypothetical protein
MRPPTPRPRAPAAEWSTGSRLSGGGMVDGADGVWCEP